MIRIWRKPRGKREKERNQRTQRRGRRKSTVKASFCCLLRLRALSKSDIFVICNSYSRYTRYMYSICNIIRNDAACDKDNFTLRELRADANTSTNMCLFFALSRGWELRRASCGLAFSPSSELYDWVRVNQSQSWRKEKSKSQVVRAAIPSTSSNLCSIRISRKFYGKI